MAVRDVLCSSYCVLTVCALSPSLQTAGVVTMAEVAWAAQQSHSCQKLAVFLLFVLSPSLLMAGVVMTAEVAWAAQQSHNCQECAVFLLFVLYSHIFCRWLGW